jgi:hypothetical protein
LVPNEKKSACWAMRSAISAGARQLDHRADHVMNVNARIGHHLLGRLHQGAQAHLAPRWHRHQRDHHLGHHHDAPW